MMKVYHAVRNVIWIVFTGIVAALFFCILGALWCMTVVGIPFGMQAFKFARLAFLPYGKQVHLRFREHPCANVVWSLLGGFLVAFFIFFSGLLSCLTLVGIPSGLRAMKFALLAFAPFGAVIEAQDSAA